MPPVTESAQQYALPWVPPGHVVAVKVSRAPEGASVAASPLLQVMLPLPSPASPLLLPASLLPPSLLPPSLLPPPSRVPRLSPPSLLSRMPPLSPLPPLPPSALETFPPDELEQPGPTSPTTRKVIP